MRKLLYSVIFLCIFVFGLTFAARNPQSVQVSYYFGIEGEWPLASILLAVLITGVAAGYILALVGGYRRSRRRYKRLKQGPVANRTETGTDLALRKG